MYSDWPPGPRRLERIARVTGLWVEHSSGTITVSSTLNALVTHTYPAI